MNFQPPEREDDPRDDAEREEAARLTFLQRCNDFQRLRELLAVIHNDGGHHTHKVGTARSVLDAEIRWSVIKHRQEMGEKAITDLRELEEGISKLLPGVRYMDQPDGGAPTLLEQLRRMAEDAARYHKLRGYMSSNVQEGWGEVERMGAVAAWMSWQDADAYLDALPECNVGLMERAPK